MTGRQLRRRHRLKRTQWLLIRWAVVTGFLCGCFLYIYPRQLINDSPDILALLANAPVEQGAFSPLLAPVLRFLSQTLQWLLVWFPEREVLPFLYPALAPYINPGVEYPWLLFLAVCMAASVAGSFLIMAIWRFLSRLGIRAARRARRAVWLFFIAAALVILLNAGLAALVFMFWASGRQLAAAPVWGWLMHLSLFVAVPAVAILSAWRAAPARVSGKGCFFR